MYYDAECGEYSWIRNAQEKKKESKLSKEQDGDEWDGAPLGAQSILM
jgi:hypothetical protein